MGADQPVHPPDDLEQCLAQIIQVFWADALSSTVSLNVVQFS